MKNRCVSSFALLNMLGISEKPVIGTSSSRRSSCTPLQVFSLKIRDLFPRKSALFFSLFVFGRSFLISFLAFSQKMRNRMGEERITQR